LERSFGTFLVACRSSANQATTLMETGFIVALTQIMMVNIVLSGDNAVVIALAGGSTRRRVAAPTMFWLLMSMPPRVWKTNRLITLFADPDVQSAES
jgi:hypothetical protein